MPKITCSACGQRISVPEEYVGRTVKCPACKERLVVLNGTETAVEPPPKVVAVPPSPEPIPPQNNAAVAVAPMAATPPTLSELLQKHPRVAVAAGLSFLWSLALVGVAMMQVADKQGGLALLSLFSAAVSVLIGMMLLRRLPQAFVSGLVLNGTHILFLILQIINGGNPLFVLLLVISVILMVLLWLERQALPPRTEAPAPTASSTTPTAPFTVVIADDTPSVRSNCHAMFWLFICLLVLVPAWELLTFLGFKMPVVFTAIVGVCLLAGGIFALICLIRSGSKIRKQPNPLRAYGLVGGYGLVGLLFLEVLRGGAGVAYAYMAHSPLDVPISNLTFAEFDGRFGVGGIDTGKSASRDRMTVAQIEAELKQYLGQRVRWDGTVLEVKDEMVAISVAPTIHQQMLSGNYEAAANRLLAAEQGKLGQDEIQVVLKLHEPQEALSLTKGQKIRYSGVLRMIGDPYPYVLDAAKVE